MNHISHSMGMLINKIVVFGVLRILKLLKRGHYIQKNSLFGVIGPYFVENGDGTTVTVNSERYGYMITDCFLPAIEEYDLENMWFPQDGATYHTTRANMALLQETFPGHIISRLGDTTWRTGHQDHAI